jgi:putative redox protein
MGGEFLLLGLGGCFLSTLLGAFKAEHDDFPTEAIEIAVTGTLVSMPSRFSEFTVDVYASETLKDRLAKSLLKAERGCIVHNTLKPATPVHFQYHWIDFPSVMPAPSAG